MKIGRLKQILSGNLEIPSVVEYRFTDTLVSLGADAAQATIVMKPTKLRPVKRLILIAAVIAITTATAFAASPELRNAIREIGNIYQQEQSVMVAGVGRVPVSENLRAYLDTHEGERWVSEATYEDEPGRTEEYDYQSHWQKFVSLEDAAGFFGVELVTSPLLARLYVFTEDDMRTFVENGLDEIYCGEPGVIVHMNVHDNSITQEYIHAHVAAQYYFGDGEARVSYNAAFIISNKDDNETSTENSVDINITRTMLHPDSGTYSTPDVVYISYTSPENGVVAVIEVDDGGVIPALARFSINDVIYTIMCMATDGAQGVEMLKEIIDSLL